MSDPFLEGYEPVRESDESFGHEFTGLDFDNVEEEESGLTLVYHILALADEDILHMIDCVIKAKPHLRKAASEVCANQSVFAALWSGATERAEPKQVRDMNNLNSFQVSDTTLPLAELSRESEYDVSYPPKCQEPAVQFSCHNYFVSENEDTITLEVMRAGNIDFHARVAYETADGSAVAGGAYESQKGIVKFSPGEAWKTFTIPIIDNEEWDTTVSFDVIILEKGTEGAIVGETTWKCSVHIINDEAFPTDRYAEEIKDGQGERIAPVGLLMEYMKLQWSNNEIRRGTKKLLFVGLYHNMRFTLGLFMNLFLLKIILVPSKSDAEFVYKRHCLVAIALLIFFPFVLGHFLEYYKFNWKVGGTSRALLQKALLRKYMTCAAASRFELKDGVMIMAVARDCQHLVQKGYMGFIALMNVLCNLFLLCAFQFLAPWVFNLPPRLSAFVPMIIFPVVLFVAMAKRNATSIEVLFERNNQEVELVDGVIEISNDYQLIKDYEAESKFMTWFEASVTRFNAADMTALKLLVNNAYITRWITTLFVAGYTYVGGIDVIHGKLSLAMYLTNIAVFTQMGAAYGKILNTCVDIQTGFPALLRITKLLNLESDDLNRMGWTRFQSSISAETAIEIDNDKAIMKRVSHVIDGKRTLIDPTPEFDLLPIWIKDFKLIHAHIGGEVNADPSNDMDAHFQFHGSIELKQGQLISFIGPHSGGKSTLLRVLGGTLLPHLEMIAANQLFVPSHLRVVHVPGGPMFFHGTLLQNLTFGVRPGDADDSRERAEKIMRRLGLPDQVVSLMDENSIHGKHWLEVVCLSHRVLLSIARALIANPQVICIHKPTNSFSENEGKRVLSVLKEFVVQRGLEQGLPTNKTRLRTCIMSNVSLLAKDYADDIIHVSRECMRRIDKSTLDIDTFKQLIASVE